MIDFVTLAIVAGGSFAFGRYGMNLVEKLYQDYKHRNTVAAAKKLIAKAEADAAALAKAKAVIAAVPAVVATPPVAAPVAAPTSNPVA